MFALGVISIVVGSICAGFGIKDGTKPFLYVGELLIVGGLIAVFV